MMNYFVDSKPTIIHVREIFMRFARVSLSRTSLMSLVFCFLDNLHLHRSLSPLNRKIKSQEIKFGFQYLISWMPSSQRAWKFRIRLRTFITACFRSFTILCRRHRSCIVFTYLLWIAII